MTKNHVSRLLNFLVVITLLFPFLKIDQSFAHSQNTSTQTELIKQHQNVDLIVQDGPPVNCQSSNIQIINPYNSLETLEAKFCESSIAGRGNLWLRSHAIIIHLVKIIPEVGVENLDAVSILTWGPEHWFLIAEDVRLDPGEHIRIRTSRFGSTARELNATLNGHITIISNLLFVGETPAPGMNTAEAIFHYGHALPVAGEIFSLFSDCRDALIDGSKVDFFECAIDIAESDSALNVILGALKLLGQEISKSVLEGLLKFMEISINLSKILSYIIQASDYYQDVQIVVYYPSGEESPIVPCIGCTNDARFKLDKTLPDGMVVSPNQSLVKTWRVRNSGSTTWGSGYQLVFVGGEQMGAPSAVNVPAAVPEQEVDISVNLSAPSTEGDHIGYWQMRNPQGTYFGPRIYVDITVQNGVAPPSISNYSLNCSNCPSTVEPGTSFLPVFQVSIGSGQLLETRGDMLRNSDGNLFGAWQHVGVIGVVNPGETYDFTFYAEHPITAPNSEGTYYSTWKLWQDGQFVGETYTIEFEVKNGGGTNHPPNAPSLTDPGDWAVFEGTTPTLKAQHNGDPDGDGVNEYYFEIFESHDNHNSGWTTSTSWTPPTLGYYGYQWHVKVRDSRGTESNWSEVRHFNIKNPTPIIYDFHWEWCRDAWGGPEKVCFCAQTSGGGLELKLNSANDGSESGIWKTIGHADTNINCNTDSDNPANWGQLEVPAGSYLVRLYQRPNVGGWDAANTADVVVSLPADQRPGPPFILQPASNSYQNSTTVHFKWQVTYRTDDYHLLISAEPDFDPTLVDQHFPVGTNTFNFTFLEEYETVYVKVIASGPYGTHEYPNSFHIDTTPPTSSITSLPAVSYDSAISINWSGTDARAGLRWYHVQVRDGDRLDSVWEDWLVNTTKTAALFRGQSGHTYYFRVRAMDEVGNWESWPAGDGDTYTMIDPSAAPQTAWWNANYALKRNLVILNNDSDTIPSHYPMHLHFDATTNPTSAEIYNASLASTKGDDVRIIYDNQLELDRFVQRFSASEINIWFPLHVALGGGQTDNSSYQIYYGYSGSSNPPADLNDVFLPEADVNTKGLWHFQNGNGGTVTDTSGRNHHGAFYNPGWGDGYHGWTGVFNGVNAAVNAGTSSDFAPGAFTIEGWVYVDESAYLGDWPYVFGKRVPGVDGGYALQIFGNGNLRFIVRTSANSPWVISNDPIALNQWNHIAAVHNGVDRQYIYINGVQSGSISSAPVQHSPAPLWFGYTEYSANPFFFPGKIQHVRFSNIARHSFPYAKIDVEASVLAGVPIDPPGSGTADLAILGLGTYPGLDGGILVQAVVQNQGDLPTLNGFYTDIYMDHLPTGSGDYTGSLRFWVNDPIEAGATITLTTVLDGVSGNIAQINASPTSESTFTLYAQTDSAGSVGEPNEANNIYTEGVQTCVASADGYEGDDSYDSATLIGENVSQVHNIDGPGDKDWFEFDAQAGITYTLRTYGLGRGADTYLYVYDTDGSTLLASNDDYGGSLASLVEWSAAVDGRYYILVQHWNPNVGGCGTRYSFVIGDIRLYLPNVTR